MEMVIAIALGLILLYVVYTALNNAGKATVNTLAQVKLHNRARAVIGRMMRDLESIHPASRFASTGTPVGVAVDEKNLAVHACLTDVETDYDRDGNPDTNHELVWIKYAYDSTNERIMRDWNYTGGDELPVATIGSAITSGAPKEMLTGVKAFKITCDGLDGSNSPQTEEITGSKTFPAGSGIVWPETITVSFTLKDAQSGISRDFSFTAFIPGN